MSGRRLFWVLGVPLLVLFVGMVVGGWLILKGLKGAASALGTIGTGEPYEYEDSSQLTIVRTPERCHNFAWSADGAWLAGSGGGKVFVIDVAKETLTNTLDLVGSLAFSPDGKWLAVGGAGSILEAGPPPQLTVFDVPGFTKKFSARGKGGKSALAVLWAPDSKTVYALDDEALLPGEKEAAVRRWSVPAFTELPALSAPQEGTYREYVVSPDSRAVAVADVRKPIAGKTDSTLVVRLFDVDKGSERCSFEPKSKFGVLTGAFNSGLRFTKDSKAVGLLADGNKLAWWDAGTGKPMDREPGKAAPTPADSRHPFSPDGVWQARGYTVHGKLVGAEWGKPKNQFGEFIDLKNREGKTHTWRVGDGNDKPAAAFSPDGKKMAGSVYRHGDPKNPGSGGSFIVIWSVPK